MKLVSETSESIFEKVFKEPKWRGKDAFPSTPEWKAEVEKYLLFLEQHRQLDRFLPRLNDERQKRDETLAEIQAAYFIEALSGYPIILWEPDVEPFALEFEFGRKGQSILCEVKSPGWEREVFEEQGVYADRLNQPKYIQAEARSTAPWRAIRESVKKAYPKFPNNKPSLLVINDDVFLTPIEVPNEIEIALFCPKAKSGLGDGYLAEDGCFVGNTYQNLGGVLCMQVQSSYGIIQYRSHFVRNPNALPDCKIPPYVHFGKKVYATGMLARRIKLFFDILWVRIRYGNLAKRIGNRRTSQ